MATNRLWLVYIVNDKLVLIKKSSFSQIQKMTAKKGFLLAQMDFFSDLHRDEFIRYLDNLNAYKTIVATMRERKGMDWPANDL